MTVNELICLAEKHRSKGDMVRAHKTLLRARKAIAKIRFKPSRAKAYEYVAFAQLAFGDLGGARETLAIARKENPA